MLAGVASVASAFTLDTAIVKTDDGSSVSAFEAALNQTKQEAAAVDGINVADQLHFTTASAPTITITLSDMYSTEALPEGTLTLSTLSFLSRPDSSNQGYESVTVSVNDKSVTSTSYTTDLPVSGNSTYRAVTWTFSDTLTFSADDVLTVTFAATSVEMGMGVFQTETGYTFGGVNPVYTNSSNQYYDFFRLEVIPEPATATLSLLALAGLAARRRRQ